MTSRVCGSLSVCVCVCVCVCVWRGERMSVCARARVCVWGRGGWVGGWVSMCVCVCARVCAHVRARVCGACVCVLLINFISKRIIFKSVLVC